MESAVAKALAILAQIIGESTIIGGIKVVIATTIDVLIKSPIRVIATKTKKLPLCESLKTHFLFQK